MTHYYDYGHEIASSATVPPSVTSPPPPPPVSGGRRSQPGVTVTEEEYASMRQAVVAVARLRLMHRPYRGVADVDTCESCPDMLYPCPTARIVARDRGDHG